MIMPKVYPPVPPPPVKRAHRYGLTHEEAFRLTARGLMRVLPQAPIPTNLKKHPPTKKT